MRPSNDPNDSNDSNGPNVSNGYNFRSMEIRERIVGNVSVLDVAGRMVLGDRASDELAESLLAPLPQLAHQCQVLPHLKPR